MLCSNIQYSFLFDCEDKHDYNKLAFEHTVNHGKRINIMDKYEFHAHCHKKLFWWNFVFDLLKY